MGGCSACEMTKVLVLLGESGLLRPSIPSLEKHLVGEENASSWPGREAGADRRGDPSLTATSGVAAIAELVDKLDVVGIFDRGIGSIKRRNRGASAGELLVGLAQSQLLGGDALVGLDRQRADLAAVELSVVPVLASTTAGGLARRFGPDQLAGVRQRHRSLDG